MWERWSMKLAWVLVVWGLITVTINAKNAYAFRLQNATIAALAERGSFTLRELEVPDFRLIVGEETFRISEDIYPMKQPGQTMVGALVYRVIMSLGLTYKEHYLYVSSLITMYTSALLVAISSLVIARLGGWVSGGIFVFATILWPYAGVTHHDVMAVCLIVVALWHNQRQRDFGAGFWSVLAIFFSMLPLPIPISLLLLAKNKGRMIWGMILGLIPTLLFNTWVFGKPWLVANLAGKVSDTVPMLSLSNFLQKLWFYLGNPTTAIWAFSPVLIFGVIGIWQKQRSLLIPILFQLLYICSIETYGGHQYGPRYLLPTLPFLVMGVSHWIRSQHSRRLKLVWGVALAYSVGVALIGALQTVMLPHNQGYNPYQLLLAMTQGEGNVMRVWKYGVAWIGAGLVMAWGSKQTARSRDWPKK